MAALVGCLSVFASCDDDDDDKDSGSAAIPTARYAGKATLSVNVLNQAMEFETADTVDIAPDSKGEFANISFASRVIEVAQMSMTIKLGSFGVDSVVVAKASDNSLELSRASQFTTSTQFEMGAMPGGTKEVIGTFDGGAIKDGKATVSLKGIAVGQMPGTIDVTFEGSEIK